MSGFDPAVFTVKEELLEDEETSSCENSIKVETEMKNINFSDIIIKKEPTLFVKIKRDMELDRAVKEEINPLQEIKTEWKPFDATMIKGEMKDINLQLLQEIPFNEKSIKVEADMKTVSLKSEPRLTVVIKRNMELERAVEEKILSALQVGKHILRNKEEKTCVPQSTLDQINLLAGHEKTVHPRLTMFVCGKCNRFHHAQHSLKDHYCRVHENDLRCKLFQDNTMFKKRLNYLEQEINKHSVVYCATCNMSFENKKILALHCKIHLVKGTGETYTSMNQENVLTSLKPYSCSFCSKKFAWPSQLKIHERTHTGIKPYSCSFCSKKFTQLGQVKQHERTHTDIKPYSCSICSKKFAQSCALEKHERTHTGIKRHSCLFCSKKFARSGHLKQHERIHTGIKPYSCSFCSKKFAQSGDLKKHERTHTGIKPYSCSFCSKKFAKLGSLKLHESKHTSFCCEKFA